MKYSILLIFFVINFSFHSESEAGIIFEDCHASKSFFINFRGVEGFINKAPCTLVRDDLKAGLTAEGKTLKEQVEQSHRGTSSCRKISLLERVRGRLQKGGQQAGEFLWEHSIQALVIGMVAHQLITNDYWKTTAKEFLKVFMWNPMRRKIAYIALTEEILDILNILSISPEKGYELFSF